jgi:hypothetical protein
MFQDTPLLFFGLAPAALKKTPLEEDVLHVGQRRIRTSEPYSLAGLSGLLRSPLIHEWTEFFGT